jgi:hypothetical protein
MQRRKYLAAIGSLAAGGAAAMGTGAITTVEGDRGAEVIVENDEDAFLGLSPLDDDRASINSNTGNLELDFVTGEGGNDRGLNPNSTTNFVDVFELRNQGTNPIFIRILTGSGTKTAGFSNGLHDVAGIESPVIPYDDTSPNGKDEYGYFQPGSSLIEKQGGHWVIPAGFTPSNYNYTPIVPGERRNISFQFKTGNDPDFNAIQSAEIKVVAVAIGSARDLR